MTWQAEGHAIRGAPVSVFAPIVEAEWLRVRLVTDPVVAICHVGSTIHPTAIHPA